MRPSPDIRVSASSLSPRRRQRHCTASREVQRGKVAVQGGGGERARLSEQRKEQDRGG